MLRIRVPLLKRRVGGLVFHHFCSDVPKAVVGANGDKGDGKREGGVKGLSLNTTLSWVDRSSLIPDKARPYLHLARVDKQVGTLLLLWPCYWSTALAAPMNTLPDPMLMCQFGLGAFLMRGAGCTINDLWDKDFDKHVERTKNRPLASGAISVNQAYGFLALQLSGGLGVLLSLPHTLTCFKLGMASMPFVIAYPAMKRYVSLSIYMLLLLLFLSLLLGQLQFLRNSFLFTD